MPIPACIMKPYKAIIFDMDGTVLDTLDELTHSLAHIFRQHGLPEKTSQEVRACLGYGYIGLIQRAVPDLPVAEQEQLAREFKDWYGAHCAGHTCLYAGIHELLQALKDAGRQTAIVSNKGQAAVTTLHEEFFSGLVTFSLGESPLYQKKPAPDMVWEALKRLGCAQEDAVYIGDSEVDKRTADNAGLDSILVTWGFRDPAFLEALQPDYLVQTPQELQTLLLSGD
ncbi:HAD family hydrolase [Megasphaera hominis]|jgi:phosphoglycolate phosphatase|nr:HAD family hydrolase [Megasphaera hominis]